MIKRIQEIMQARHLSPSQFADEVGIQRSGMSHILSGRNKPSLEFVLKVLKRYPEIKAAWLLYGSEDETSNGNLIADEISVQTEMPLFSEIHDEPVRDSKIKTPRMMKKSDPGEKIIEKIVVFYSDRTFKEYSPSE